VLFKNVKYGVVTSMSKRKIFIEGKNVDERTCFGWQDQDAALYGLREGYLNAANDLVSLVIERGKIGDVAILDTYIFPIFFLYRHTIELCLKLKDIYYRCYRLIPKGEHDLSILWKEVKEKVIEKAKGITSSEKLRSVFNMINIEEIEEMILELDDVDKKGDVFRYLIDKNDNLYFTSQEFIDYINLKENINYLYETLDYIYNVIEKCLDKYSIRNLISNDESDKEHIESSRGKGEEIK